MTKIFTTGQIAKICQVAPRTVSKWIDSGRLKGYSLPDSNDRRVTCEELIKFMKKVGIPIPEELNETIRVLHIGIDAHILQGLNNFELIGCRSSDDLSIGIALQRHKPHCILIAAKSDDLAIQLKQLWPDILRVGIVEEPLENFDETFSLNAEPALIAHRIETLVEKRKQVA